MTQRATEFLRLTSPGVVFGTSKNAKLELVRVRYGNVTMPSPPGGPGKKIIFPFVITDEPRAVQERRLRAHARALYETIKHGPWLADVTWDWPAAPGVSW